MPFAIFCRDSTHRHVNPFPDAQVETRQRVLSVVPPSIRPVEIEPSGHATTPSTPTPSSVILEPLFLPSCLFLRRVAKSIVEACANDREEFHQRRDIPSNARVQARGRHVFGSARRTTQKITVSRRPSPDSRCLVAPGTSHLTRSTRVPLPRVRPRPATDDLLQLLQEIELIATSTIPSDDASSSKTPRLLQRRSDLTICRRSTVPHRSRIPGQHRLSKAPGRKSKIRQVKGRDVTPTLGSVKE